jgi:hypothetical protein
MGGGRDGDREMESCGEEINHFSESCVVTVRPNPTSENNLRETTTTQRKVHGGGERNDHVLGCSMSYSDNVDV